MALTDEQRGPRATWLYRHRVATFGKGDAALVALAEALRERGAYRAPDTIKGWESSEERSPIPPDVLPHLEAIFNDLAPTPRRPITADDLLVALNRQADAITALVDRVDLMLAAHATASTELMRAMAAVVSGRALPETPDASEPVARAGTGR